MASIGLTIGQKADETNLRYSKIVFLADSDVDGGHINTLLTNFFFTFWPELFSRGSIQFAKAPLFEVITDKETMFVETEDQLEKLKKSGVKIKEIQRNKGLGEMSPEAFKYTLARDEYTKITIDDINSAKRMLDVCFGKDTNLRKELLLDPDSSGVDHTEEATPAKKAAKAALVEKTTTKKRAATKATKKVSKKK
jgi:DNA gyrase/topoisomerase IV subunit B